MKIAIVGFDTEGRATYDYLAQLGGHEVTICDQNPEVTVPDGVPTQLGDGYLKGLDQFDCVVRTPGLHPRFILEANPGIAERITTQTNLFLGGSPTTNIIGVTGTKGKGTTSTLITKMLEAADRDVRLGGNIGVPPLTFLSELDAESWVVLELSSFQLIDLRYSPHIAACLMVVPEHLNWHASLAEYFDAKEHLFIHQTIDDVAVYNAENENSFRIASAGLGQTVPYMSAPGAAVVNGIITIDGQDVIATDDLKLLGKHNWQNACAAVTAVWQAGFHDPEPMRKVLAHFSGLEHRLELVRELNDVKYFNDSFSSGLLATEAAIDAVSGQKVVIVGGYDRMLPLEHFGSFMAQRDDVRTLLIIGQSGPRLAEALQKADYGNYELAPEFKTMSEVVAKATSLAQPGDVIILSPGFASFDMFKNFEDRGLQFKAAVVAL